jgi:hypothetical protein
VTCVVHGRLHLQGVKEKKGDLSTKLPATWLNLNAYSTFIRVDELCTLTGKNLHRGFLALENSLKMQLEIFSVSLVMPKKI